MSDWKAFETLVANIHRVLNASDYDVQPNVTLEEPSGARHQIDVLLSPRTAFAGPVLVSCKDWSTPVGIDHIREWADIVQHTGSAAGVIVASTGFSTAAIDAVRNRERRLSLWRPRQLTLDDFGPDEASEAGYVAGVQVNMDLRSPRYVDETFKLDVDVPKRDGEPKEVRFSFSYASRNAWYLRNDVDEIVGNLWDQFVEQVESSLESGQVTIAPNGPQFLVLDGTRLAFRGASFDVRVTHYRQVIEVDLLRDAVGYENVLTGEVKVVPLNLI